MPWTSLNSFESRAVVTDVRIGIPPATAASNLRRTWFSCARAASLGPLAAMAALLAVTTLLPFERACAMYVVAGSMPPMSSTTMSISGSFRISLTSAVYFSLGMSMPLSLAGFLLRIFTISISRPVVSAIF